MREFLNAILVTIGAASLNDEEFTGLSISVYGYDQATYDALLAVLVSRESVSSLRDRLYHIFKAKGAEINQTETGQSNIYVGSVLE